MQSYFLLAYRGYEVSLLLLNILSEKQEHVSAIKINSCYSLETHFINTTSIVLFWFFFYSIMDTFTCKISASFPLLATSAKNQTGKKTRCFDYSPCGSFWTNYFIFISIFNISIKSVLLSKCSSTRCIFLIQIHERQWTQNCVSSCSFLPTHTPFSFTHLPPTTYLSKQSHWNSSLISFRQLINWSSILSLVQWFATGGSFGQVGRRFWLSPLGMWYWHLVGRGQRCC